MSYAPCGSGECVPLSYLQDNQSDGVVGGAECGVRTPREHEWVQPAAGASALVVNGEKESKGSVDIQ